MSAILCTEVLTHSGYSVLRARREAKVAKRAAKVAKAARVARKRSPRLLLLPLRMSLMTCSMLILRLRPLLPLR